MVTETAPVEQEEVPAEPQDGGTPEEATPESAPAEEPSEPDEITQLRSQMEDMQKRIQEYESQPRKSEAELRAEAEAKIRAERDRQEALDRDRKEREQRDREELHDSLRATLVSAGYPDVEPDTVARTAERYINKRYDQITNAERAELNTVLRFLDHSLRTGKPPEAPLSPRALQYAEQLETTLSSAYEQMRQSAQAEITAQGWKSPEEVAAAIEAARKDERAKLRPQEDIATVEGAQPSAGGAMTQARWDALTPIQRQDPKNQAAYDEWCRKNP